MKNQLQSLLASNDSKDLKYYVEYVNMNRGANRVHDIDGYYVEGEGYVGASDNDWV